MMKLSVGSVKDADMTQANTRASELTVEELLLLIRSALREELKEIQQLPPHNQLALLELEPLHVGAWVETGKWISREEYYDDER